MQNQSLIPILETGRLLLRGFSLSDASRVRELAGHPLIAATTGAIPHPYPEGAAEDWISEHEEAFRNGYGADFAVVLKDSGLLIGAIALGVWKNHFKAELGYWIGVDHWGQGYATEAAKAVVPFGFEAMKLNKITSRHLKTNIASGKVMKAAGLIYEGTLRQEFFKNGVFHDLDVYGLLRQDYLESAAD